MRAYLLEGVEADDTLGSLCRQWDNIWFKTALDQHNAVQWTGIFSVS